MDAEEIETLEAVKRWVNGERVKWREFKDTARHAKRIYNANHTEKIKYCYCSEGSSKLHSMKIVDWYEELNR